MLKPIAYIETTIPSFYHDIRTSPDIVARRDWTRSSWAIAPSRYRLVTSEPVIRELEGGIPEHAEARLGMVVGFPLLPVEPEITMIVRAYVRHQLMPADPTGDALHLALASYHKCDYLVTWNCLHLANANKFGHIRRINTMLGLFTPTITTPLELMGEIDAGENTE